MQAAPHIRLQSVPDILVGNPEIEPFEVEISATLAFGLLVIRVFRVADHLMKLFIAGNAADVFGWPALAPSMQVQSTTLVVYGVSDVDRD